MRKKYEGFPIGTLSLSSPWMGTRYSRIIRCVGSFGHTFVIAFPVVLTPPLVQEFCSYLADFPCLGEAEAASYKGLVTECKVHDVLKQVGLNKSQEMDGWPYEVYLKMLYMFIPILTDMFNHWFAQGPIPDSITKGMITLLKKGSRHVWEDLDDYRPITLLYIE